MINMEAEELIKKIREEEKKIPHQLKITFSTGGNVWVASCYRCDSKVNTCPIVEEIIRANKILTRKD